VVALDQCAARGCVVVVDDDDDIRSTFADILRGQGYCVREARNGQEALDLLCTTGGEPCLMLLDLMMPVMSGWEFIEEAQKRQLLGSVALVIVSAFVADGEVEGFHTLGKPVALPKLIATVEQHCPAA
jgi:CheY-like chemotaxis protein